MRINAPSIILVLVLAGAALAAVDLQRVQQRTLVVYTTPALKDVLENTIIPAYLRETGYAIEPVYVPAGEQYNRLRMGGPHPEADVFLHASPLYIEKGSHEPTSFFDGLEANVSGIDAAFRSSDPNAAWVAFAWSPLVEVFSPKLGSAPDLATSDARFGFAHPLLSNNGIYNVILFETVSPAAGRHALARTTVQPTNARATINGVADGSFDVTLGYEAVALLYEGKGATVKHELPLVGGQRVVVPVLMTVGVVHGHAHRDAQRFASFLFTRSIQDRMAGSYLRPTLPNATPLTSSLDATLATLPPLNYDWSRWSDLEQKLPTYQVRS